MTWTRWTLGLLSVLIISLSAVHVAVPEQHTGIILRFGKPVRLLDEAGLAWKLPWPLERAVVLDGRQRVVETPHTEMLTAEKKNVILLSFAVWSIAEPLTFYRAVGTLEAGDQKLSSLLTAATIGILGRYELSALVSTNPDELRVAEMEQEILDETAGPALETYGIALHQVGFQRLSLPAENIGKVFDQMRAERRKESAKYIAAGEREAKKIRSDTDLEAARIRAEAQEAATRLRGTADAEAARIRSEAHEADPEFYRFLRSLQSLPDLVGSETTMVLRTDITPFQLLETDRPNLPDPPPIGEDRAKEGDKDDARPGSHE